MKYKNFKISHVNTKSQWSRALLVETALLGQGLPSVNNSRLAEQWPDSKRINLLWLDNGRIVAGGLDDFLEIRQKTWLQRVDDRRLEQAIATSKSGFLTASAVMRIAAGTGAFLVVTAGMGGIRGSVVSADLLCLINLPLLLIATAPKDSQDLSLTVDYLRRNNVRVIGNNTDMCFGFLFKGKQVLLDGKYQEGYLQSITEKGVLLLNPLPPDSLIADRELLLKSMAKGEEAIKNCGDYHPAVNKSLDRATQGRLSFLQLQSLIKNIGVGLALTINPILNA